MDSSKFKNLLSSNIEDLLKIRDQASDAYHNGDDLILTDQQYDLLIEKIKEEKEDYKIPVGAKLREKENRTKLPWWLGSADKITSKDPNKLKNWIKKQHFTTNKKSYIITEKLDGVSCLLTCKNKKINLYTRGDGVIGADISYLVPFFKIPKIDKNISVRGELIITKKEFLEKYKEKKVNGRIYKNPRNMVAGLINSKTCREGLESINFVTYEIVDNSMYEPERQLQELEDMGFLVAKNNKVSNISLKSLTEHLANMKSESIYEIDGIVVQSNLSYDRNTKDNPEYLFAFKVLLGDMIKETMVTDVVWSPSKLGALKPVVMMNQVYVGVDIDKATGHNAKYIEKNNIGPGSIIRVTRSNEVIPYIVEVVKCTKAKFPDVEYFWDKTHTNIYTTNVDPETLVKFISAFFRNMGVKSVDDATIQKLYDNGYDTILKILEMKEEDISDIPGLGNKSANKIIENIHKSLQKITKEKLVGSAGIFGGGIGKRKVKALAQGIPNIFMEKMSSKELYKKILQVDGFSDITAKKVVKNMNICRKFLEAMDKYVTYSDEKQESVKYANQKFVFSGFRDANLQDYIEKNGGKIATSVSKQTTCVLVSGTEGMNSSKVKKALELGVKVIERDNFQR